MLGLIGRLLGAGLGVAKVATGHAPSQPFDLRSFMSQFVGPSGASSGPSFGSDSASHANAFRMANMNMSSVQPIRAAPPPPRA